MSDPRKTEGTKVLGWVIKAMLTIICALLLAGLTYQLTLSGEQKAELAKQGEKIAEQGARISSLEATNKVQYDYIKEQLGDIKRDLGELKKRP